MKLLVCLVPLVIALGGISLMILSIVLHNHDGLGYGIVAVFMAACMWGAKETL